MDSKDDNKSIAWLILLGLLGASFLIGFLIGRVAVNQQLKQKTDSLEDQLGRCILILKGQEQVKADPPVYVYPDYPEEAIRWYA